MIRAVLRLILQGLADAFRSPLTSLTTLVAVTFSAFLAGLLLMLVHNLNLELRTVRGEVLYQVYWQANAPGSVVSTQWEAFKGYPYLKDLRTYTPEQAAKELVRELSDGEAASGNADLTWLTSGEIENPLPPTALLAFSPQVADPESWTRQMLYTLQELPGVASVNVNPLSTAAVDAWRAVSERVFWPLIGLLAVITALVTANTVKLALIKRRDEIEILHLVGARGWYIRLPLLVTGATYGLLGSGLALGLLKGAQVLTADALRVPPLFLHIHYLPLEQAAGLAGVLTLACVFASFVAVKP